MSSYRHSTLNEWKLSPPVAAFRLRPMGGPMRTALFLQAVAFIETLPVWAFIHTLSFSASPYNRGQPFLYVCGQDVHCQGFGSDRFFHNSSDSESGHNLVVAKGLHNSTNAQIIAGSPSLIAGFDPRSPTSVQNERRLSLRIVRARNRPIWCSRGRFHPPRARNEGFWCSRSLTRSCCIGRTVLGFATGEMFHKTALLE